MASLNGELGNLKMSRRRHSKLMDADAVLQYFREIELEVRAKPKPKPKSPLKPMKIKTIVSEGKVKHLAI